MEYHAITMRIFELIQSLNMTQAQFAELTGIPRSTFSHLQSGRNKPSLDLLDKIVKAFPNEIDITQLVYGRKENPQTQTSQKEIIKQDYNTSGGAIQEILVLNSDGSYEKFIKEVK